LLFISSNSAPPPSGPVYFELCVMKLKHEAHALHLKINSAVFSSTSIFYPLLIVDVDAIIKYYTRRISNHGSE